MSTTTEGHTPPLPDDTAQRTFASLTSMMQFDEQEVQGIVRSIIANRARKMLHLIYWRDAAHIANLSLRTLALGLV